MFSGLTRILVDSIFLRWCSSLDLVKSKVASNQLVLTKWCLTTTKQLTSVSTYKKTSVTLKNNSVLKFGNIAQLRPPSKDTLDSWSKNFCLKTVYIYTGAKKLVSKNLSIEFYNQLVDGKLFIFLE